MKEQVLQEKELTVEEKQKQIIKHQVELLKKASLEIQSLKRHNHVLYSKQEVFDKMYRVLTINDRNNVNACCDKTPDIEWEIQRHINDLG